MKKRRERKKGTCQKCGEYFYVDDHHILPRKIYGDKGETIQLCVKCHTHVHEYLNKNVDDYNDKEKLLKIWQNWLKNVKVVVTCIVLFILSLGLFYLFKG